MKHYEMLCVLPGTLAEDEVQPIVASISQIFNSKAIANVLVENMGKSKLAYPIQHIRYGYFQLFKFELEPGEVSALEKDVRLLGGLLRVIVQAVDPRAQQQYHLAQDPTALSAPKQREEYRTRQGKRTEEPKTFVPRETVQETAPASVASKEIVEANVPAVTTEEKPHAATKRRTTKKKISMDDIDEKLDEILQKDIDKV